MTTRVLILVEGQTEERFVKDVLAPIFFSKGLYIIPTILVTKTVKNGSNFKGGVTSFSKFEKDMQRLIAGAGDAIITTMLDYYGLPNDFPGMDSRPTHGSPRERAQHVERALAARYRQHANFIPFLALHEFEATIG